jgi:hypothetical protein
VDELGVGDARGRQRPDREVEAVDRAPAAAERVHERARHEERDRRSGDLREVLFDDRVAERPDETPE